MTARGVDSRVARTRATVLRTTLELLATVGPAGMSLTKLAAAAGVSRQTIYTHWGATTQLIAEAILEGFEGGYPQEGPVLFSPFFLRKPVADQLIDRIVIQTVPLLTSLVGSTGNADGLLQHLDTRRQIP